MMPDKCSVTEEGKQCVNPPEFIVSIVDGKDEYMFGLTCQKHKSVVTGKLGILQNEGKIKYLGLTNFDTERIKIIIEKGFKIISNQVQFSILDQRPEKIMTSFFMKHGIKIITYGTLLGGFFSEKYLNTDEPTRADLTTASLQKYKNMIDIWGGWELFQELLEVLKQLWRIRLLEPLLLMNYSLWLKTFYPNR